MATFYAVLPDGSLHDRMSTITWKVGHYTDDREPRLRDFVATSTDIEFTHGIFSTDDPDQIEYLDIYNSGGIYHEGKKDQKVIQPTNFPIITQDDPIIALSKKTNTVEKEVVRTVVQIPRILLDTMTPQTIEAYFHQAAIKLPKVITKEALIAELEKNDMVA